MIFQSVHNHWQAVNYSETQLSISPSSSTLLWCDSKGGWLRLHLRYTKPYWEYFLGDNTHQTFWKKEFIESVSDCYGCYGQVQTVSRPS